MKMIRTAAGAALLAAMAFAALPRAHSAAQTAAPAEPLHVFASNAVRTVLKALGPQSQRAAGRPLTFTYETSAAIKKDLSAGGSFDVAVVTSDLIDTLIQQGKVAPGSRADIARSSVGAGVRAGAPKPDISTPEGMKRALLAAKAIALVQDGASVPFVLKMDERLGIADQVTAKTIYASSTGAAAGHVIDGSADLVFSMVSEIPPIHGVKLAGPIPAQFDRYLVFSAGASANSANAKSAAALIRYLASPAIASTLRAKGMEPPKKSI